MIQKIIDWFMLSRLRSVYLPFLHDVSSGSAIGQCLLDAMRFVKSSHLEGDYLEFGVHKGRSFIAAHHFAKRYGLQRMQFYAFDSFQGLPPITGRDAGEFQPFQEHTYGCDKTSFLRNLHRGGVPVEKTKVIEGWYDTVLTPELKKNLPLQKASIILVDCDLYESTVPVLQWITDYVQEGTVIIFDDWFSFRGNPERGEQRAFQEWLNKHKNIQAVDFLQYGINVKSFILIPKKK